MCGWMACRECVDEWHIGEMQMRYEMCQATWEWVQHVMHQMTLIPDGMYGLYPMVKCLPN